MRFGAAITNCREGKVYPPGFTTPQLMSDIATTAEAAGFDSIWANDLQSTYDEALADTTRTPPNFFEAHTTLAYIAARTERIRMITSAVTSPLRDPILLAKQVATLDALSNGRYVLGLGLGGKRTEFDRLRGRNSAAVNRGRWLDESLDLLNALLTERQVTHEGEYFSVTDAEVFPKPVKQPFPIYLTGGGEAMLRRTATWGSGWIHMNVTPDQLADRVQELRKACDEAGTDPDRVEVCIQFDVVVAPTTQEAERIWEGSLARSIGAKRGRADGASFIVGSPDDLAGRLTEYQEAGMQHVGLIFSAQSQQHLLDQIGLVGDRVIGQFA